MNLGQGWEAPSLIATLARESESAFKANMQHNELSSSKAGMTRLGLMWPSLSCFLSSVRLSTALSGENWQ